MYNDASSPTLTNCIFWSDSPNEISNVDSTPIVAYSDVQGGTGQSWFGQGCIDAEPWFLKKNKGDLSLSGVSPCIDIGSNIPVVPNSTDIAGRPRLIDGNCDSTITVDMGAHELMYDYMGDLNYDCFVNLYDYAYLASAWQSDPLSNHWDALCDISIPADERVDFLDLSIVIQYWLHEAIPHLPCQARYLREVLGMDVQTVISTLTDSPCFFPIDQLAASLHDAGLSAAEMIEAEQVLFDAGYSPEAYLEGTALEWVERFAPVLYFDSEYQGLPMSAQVYFETMMTPLANSPSSGQITWTTPWDGPCGKPGVILVPGRDESNCGMHNNDFSTLVNGQIPTYYRVISDIDSTVDTGPKGRLRIAYWWFYGFQKYCNPLEGTGSSGEHHGDWEHIMVTTTPDRSRIDSVTYYFHGKWYTRQWAGFELIGERPVVYVGKIAHGSYHSTDHSGWMAGTPHQCCAYADFREATPDTIWGNAYDNLVGLRSSEPWMLADRIGSPYEYNGEEYTISQWFWGPHIHYKGIFCQWKLILGINTHPTNVLLDWQIYSCDGVGCGTNSCSGLVYTYPVYFDQGWPWDVGTLTNDADVTMDDLVIFFDSWLLGMQ